MILHDQLVAFACRSRFVLQHHLTAVFKGDATLLKVLEGELRVCVCDVMVLFVLNASVGVGTDELI